eukprot:TRINITY_DN19874_c0_g1_i1.p1 TRINITY_DN19874_c0_g1~~TRINITY_DN19874_c0_g1_i1.p1  ORF type:complete len:415 (+),score=57.67 TRINITY_DN19874_c0_g1_i1:758-2002(+)
MMTAEALKKAAAPPRGIQTGRCVIGAIQGVQLVIRVALALRNLAEACPRSTNGFTSSEENAMNSSGISADVLQTQMSKECLLGIWGVLSVFDTASIFVADMVTTCSDDPNPRADCSASVGGIVVSVLGIGSGAGGLCSVCAPDAGDADGDPNTTNWAADLAMRKQSMNTLGLVEGYQYIMGRRLPEKNFLGAAPRPGGDRSHPSKSDDFTDLPKEQRSMFDLFPDVFDNVTAMLSHLGSGDKSTETAGLIRGLRAAEESLERSQQGRGVKSPWSSETSEGHLHRRLDPAGQPDPAANFSFMIQDPFQVTSCVLNALSAGEAVAALAFVFKEISIECPFRSKLASADESCTVDIIAVVAIFMSLTASILWSFALCMDEAPLAPGCAATIIDMAQSILALGVGIRSLKGGTCDHGR